MENASVTTVYDPGYTTYFDLELQYSPKDGKQWFVDNWHYSFYYIVVYLISIFAGRYFMKNRQPFHLRPYLAIWNLAISAFSILATIRLAPEFFYVLKNFGFTYSLCNSGHEQYQVTSFWSFLYLHSKVPELIDTAFVVLRKQKLIFLHWFHHAMTIFVSWFIASRPVGVSRWYIIMNISVHSVMYTYFAFRALNIKVPKFIAMCITFSQICQMFVGFIVTLWSYYIKKVYEDCHVDKSRLHVSILAYVIYLGLFVNFFYNSYLLRSKAHLKTK